MNGRDNEKFRYTYSAPTEAERGEIERIRDAYRTDAGAEKLARLKKLDKRVKNSAVIAALTLGILGFLLFGLGMSMTLAWGQYAGGIAGAVAGAVPMALAAPAHAAVLKRGKKKYGAEIVRLSEELLHDR